jgi:hypothetical protein
MPSVYTVRTHRYIAQSYFISSLGVPLAILGKIAQGRSDQDAIGKYALFFIAFL